MKPKAALVKAGDKPKEFENTRGRMSLVDIERVKELAIAHPEWNIEGFTVSAPSKDTAPTVVREKPRAEVNGVADVPDQTRDENAWKAIAVAGDKSRNVGMKAVCLRCNNSLTYCRCEKPIQWVDFQTKGVVTFVPVRTTGKKV